MLSALRTPEKKKKTGKEEEEVEERGGEGSSVQVIEPTVTATATAFEQRVSEAVATIATATAVSVVQQENVAAQRKDDEEENPQGKRGKENEKAAGDDSEFVLFKGDQLRTAVQYRSSDPIQNLKVRVRARLIRGPTLSDASVPSEEEEAQASEGSTTSTPEETDFESDEDDAKDDVKWATEHISWQQKIYDNDTISAARSSSEALERHLRNLFGISKSDSPHKQEKFQKIYNRYKEEIIQFRTAKAAQEQRGAQIYTYVDYEDSVRQAVAEDVGEVSQLSITTSESSAEHNAASGCLPKLPFGSKDTSGGDDTKAKEGHSHRLHKTTEERAQSMTIVAGMRGEQIVLAQMRFFPNGVLEMRPGFSDSSSNNGKSTLFFAETPNGSLLEYSLENDSAPRAKNEIFKSMFGLSLSQREKKKMSSVNPAMTVKKAGLGGPFITLQDRYGLNRNMTNFTLLLEIVAGKNFRRDNLYVEYFVHLPRSKADPFEPQTPISSKHGGVEDIWQVGNESKKFAQGVTQVSSCTKYPTVSFLESGRHTDRVVNWCFPVELEMTVSKELSSIDRKEWPTLVFTVFSYDKWDRSTCEGFGRLQLNSECLGATCHYLNMWKPLGSLKQRMQESFTGGIIQPQDLHGLYDFIVTGNSLSTPMCCETGGTLKIRTNLVMQKQVEDIRKSKNLSRSLVFTPSKTKRPSKKKMSQPKGDISSVPEVAPHTLAEITERARERIKVLREKNARMTAQ